MAEKGKTYLTSVRKVTVILFTELQRQQADIFQTSILSGALREGGPLINPKS